MAQEIPFEFEKAGFQLQEVPWEYRWLNMGVVTDPQQSQPFDDEGVGVRSIDGVYYLHPVALSSFLMTRLDQYVLTNDPVYLDLCIRQAERFIQRSVRSRNAAYVPYEFTWNLHRHITDPVQAPWYSGMAQGQILSAFSRLYEVTGEERYLDFAHKVFHSYLNLKEPGIPWTVEILEDRWLWFEEYARDNGPSDGAFNGHLFAIFGLHDYWMVTKDERALALADGGLTTLIHFMDQWRFPGAQSYYCTSHRIRVASYHRTHIIQLGMTYNLTGESIWARLQDLFMHDYPKQVYPESPFSDVVVIKPGTYEVGSRGGIDSSAKETAIVSEERQLPFDVRGKLRGESSVSIRVTSPEFEYLWFPEIAGEVYVRGITELEEWSIPLIITFIIDSPLAVTFDENGEITQRVETNLLKGDTSQVTRRARIQGSNWIGLSGGEWDGMWISFEDIHPISES